jgi:hypothetical protein
LAKQKNQSRQPNENNENYESPNDHVCDETYEDSSVSTSSSNSSTEQANEQDRKKDRTHFDQNMYDNLERILILKFFHISLIGTLQRKI